MFERALDETDWLLLCALQENARISFSELGRRVGLTSPAVAERVRRMEEDAIITGYHAVVNPAKVGLPVNAYIRFRGRDDGNRKAEALAARLPGVVECHDLTGRDCLLLRVAVPSLDYLKNIIKQFEIYGETETSLVLASPVASRPIEPLPQRAADERL